MATTWLNSDGLYVKFGVSEATVGRGGEFEDHLSMKTVLELLVDATALTTTAAILDDNVTIPKGARIEEVQVEVETGGTSGGSGTLSVGLMKTDRTTAVSDAALVSAAATATLDTAGKRLSLINGSTAAGTSIGTNLADPNYVTAKVSATYSAGLFRVRVFWYMPGQS